MADKTELPELIADLISGYLRFLGASPDAVAKRLEREGILGARNSLFANPLALIVSRDLGVPCLVKAGTPDSGPVLWARDPRRIPMTGEGIGVQLARTAAGEFVQKFRGGAYSFLVKKRRSWIQCWARTRARPRPPAA